MISIVEFLVKKHQNNNLPKDVVDLDLPSGTLWCKYNLGATNIEEVGDYYAWGEIKPKKRYIMKNYAHWEVLNLRKSETELTKYCLDDSFGLVDNINTLEEKDDVATVKLGSKWSMPTKAQWEELYDNCTWTWTTLNNVNGYEIISKVDFFKSIFLPAGGMYTGLINQEIDHLGVYWSSSLDTTTNCNAYTCYFIQSAINSNRSGNRYGGFTVRPVLTSAL